MCWEVRKDVWGVEKCGRVYGVSGEVCWRVGRGVGMCVRVWDPVRKDVWGVEKRGEGCGRVGKCVGV